MLLADTAERAGVRRVVQVSSMRSRPAAEAAARTRFRAAYITAKTAAEADLRARDLDWTILRPGGLTDAPATGKIRLAAPPVPAGTVSRADVAAVIAALLDNPGTRHQTLELTDGDSAVAAAVQAFPSHGTGAAQPASRRARAPRLTHTGTTQMQASTS